MKISRLASKPRGLLRDTTLILALNFFDPRVNYLIVGATLFLFGSALHIWSKGCLVRNWSLTTCGPYRLVRHPFYLANFLIDEGICMFSGRWWLGVLYLVGFVAVYIPTIRKEEDSLTATHSKEYATYRAKVPALFPYRLWTMFGPLDFKWANITREKEVSRILRILAIPSYFAIVATVFHSMPFAEPHLVIVLCASIALALLLNAGSILSR